MPFGSHSLKRPFVLSRLALEQWCTFELTLTLKARCWSSLDAFSPAVCRTAWKHTPYILLMPLTAAICLTVVRFNRNRACFVRDDKLTANININVRQDPLTTSVWPPFSPLHWYFHPHFNAWQVEYQRCQVHHNNNHDIRPSLQNKILNDQNQLLFLLLFNCCLMAVECGPEIKKRATQTNNTSFLPIPWPKWKCT